MQFIEPSKRYADLIIPEGGSNQVAINILKMFIENNLVFPVQKINKPIVPTGISPI